MQIIYKINNGIQAFTSSLDEDGTGLPSVERIYVNPFLQGLFSTYLFQGIKNRICSS